VSSITRTIEQGKEHIRTLGCAVLDSLERTRPITTHEKAHVYPISVPELWHKATDSAIDWHVQANKPIRLYVHIPWCLARCTFCFYESRAGVPPEADVAAYIDCLKTELKLYAQNLRRGRLETETLYIGGGTPSVLTPEQIRQLMYVIHSAVDFVEGASLIVEVSPGTLTREKVAAFVEKGINRISIGVQSFDDQILKICGRDHDAAGAAKAYEMLREAGIPEINFDLMLALPEQTLDSFAQSVGRAIELAPSSISFLDLRVAPGSPLHKSGHYYPTWLEDICMRAIYQEMLKADGRYERTRPHYYILPKQARGRSTRVPCLDSRSGPGCQIGVGVTAYSHIGDVCFINGRNPKYQETIQSGHLPVEWALMLDEEDKTAMRAIRDVVDLTIVPNLPEVLVQYPAQVKFLKDNGLIDADYHLTDDGCLFGEEIAYMFYPAKAKPTENLVSTPSTCDSP
jgi:oxygen-independent coproporphyrinogen-3 oxidase